MHKCDVTINTAVLAKGTGDEAREGSDPSKAVIAGGSETDMRFGPYMNDVSRCTISVLLYENANKKLQKRSIRNVRCTLMYILKLAEYTSQKENLL